MPQVLISGAGRGLGLEFARQYSAAGWHVHATCRDPDRAPALSALSTQASAGSVTIHPLEVTDKRSLDALTQKLRSVPLDLLLLNAGVIGPRGTAPELVDRDSWLETFAVNTIAPLAMAGAFKHNLEKGSGKKAVAISSRMGSINGNDSGGSYAYRSSKAALNAVWHSLALDWRQAQITCAVLHPGWVKTDMGGPEAQLPVVDSVRQLLAIIDGLNLEKTGQFFNYDGAPIPW